MTFAIIKTGGKQYQVEEGQVLTVEKLQSSDGAIQFEEVLLLADGEKVTIGQPTVKGAVVSATVVEEGKGEKKIVFKFKNKTRHRKKKGHRQPFTKVRITKITA